MFWLGVAAICALSLLPQEHVPQTGLIVLGAALELVQRFLPDRFMSMADAFANVAGVCWQ